MRKLLVFAGALCTALAGGCFSVDLQSNPPSIFTLFVEQPSDTTAPAKITVNITTERGWKDMPEGSVTLHVTAPTPGIAGASETKLLTTSLRFLDAPYETLLHFVFNSDRDPTVILVHMKPASGKNAEARCTPSLISTLWDCR